MLSDSPTIATFGLTHLNIFFGSYTRHRETTFGSTRLRFLQVKEARIPVGKENDGCIWFDPFELPTKNNVSHFDKLLISFSVLRPA